jgi:hypothetical protein
MSDLQAYFCAQERRRSAYNLFNYACTLLDLERIRERLAEIKSQHEPIASLIDERMSERERLCAIAHYVVIGRIPEVKENA